ncbi:MAG: hypothetical protein ACRDBG_13860, partial [Waterburya sp.]
PTTIFNKKASHLTSPSLVYGYPMSNDKIKFEALQYLRSFLLEERSDSLRNLDLIPDKALLQELISYNNQGNFDRVMGLCGAIIGLEEMHNLQNRRAFHDNLHTPTRKQFLSTIVNNKQLFNAQITQTTSFLLREDERRLQMGQRDDRFSPL